MLVSDGQIATNQFNINVLEPSNTPPYYNIDSSIVELANVTIYAGSTLIYPFPSIKDAEGDDVTTSLELVEDSSIKNIPTFMK